MTTHSDPLTDAEVEQIRAYLDGTTEYGPKSVGNHNMLCRLLGEVDRLRAELDSINDVLSEADMATGIGGVRALASNYNKLHEVIRETGDFVGLRGIPAVRKLGERWQTAKTEAVRLRAENEKWREVGPEYQRTMADASVELEARDNEITRMGREIVKANATFAAVRALPPEPRCDHEGDCSDWSHGWDSGRNATLREVGRVLDGQPPLRDYSGTPRPPAEASAERPAAGIGSWDGLPLLLDAVARDLEEERQAAEVPDVDGWSLIARPGRILLSHDTDADRPLLMAEEHLPVGAVLAFIADQQPEPGWVAYEAPCDDCKAARSTGEKSDG